MSLTGVNSNNSLAAYLLQLAKSNDVLRRECIGELVFELNFKQHATVECNRRNRRN